MNCEARKCRRWRVFRSLLFIAGLTLLAYVPYKMIHQPEAMVGLYGILFPSSAVLALAAMLYAWKPSLAHRTSLWLSLPMGLLAAGWLTTGFECIPTLTRAVMTHPLGGLFATFHMALQHVVVSIGLGTLVVAPRATYEFFGVPLPEADDDAAQTELAADGV